MHSASRLVALATTFSSALAAFQGFNYGSTFTSGAAKQQSDFEAEFKTSQSLVGAPVTFNSARLYTMVVSAYAPPPPLSSHLASRETLTRLSNYSKRALPMTPSPPSPPPSPPRPVCFLAFGPPPAMPPSPMSCRP